MSYLEGINDSHLKSKWSDLDASKQAKLKERYGSQAKEKFSSARQRMAGEALSPSPSSKPAGPYAPGYTPDPNESSPFNNSAPYGGAYQSSGFTDAARASQDSARTALAKTSSGKTWQDTARDNAKAGANVTDLKDYDLRSFGAGGSQTMANQAKDRMGKGKSRFSLEDASQLLETGNFTAQELMDFGNSLEGEDTVFGNKTQIFLKDKIAEQVRLDKEKQMAESKKEEVAPPPVDSTPATVPGYEQRKSQSALKPPPQRTKPTPPSSQLPGMDDNGDDGGGYEYGETDPAIKDHYLNYVHEPGDYASEATDVVDRWTKKFDSSEKVAALDHRVNQSQLYWKARADEHTGNYLGDIWSYTPPKFEMGDPLKPVDKPETRDIMDETMDRIESIKPKL